MQSCQQQCVKCSVSYPWSTFCQFSPRHYFHNHRILDLGGLQHYELLPSNCGHVHAKWSYLSSLHRPVPRAHWHWHRLTGANGADRGECRICLVSASGPAGSPHGHDLSLSVCITNSNGPFGIHFDIPCLRQSMFVHESHSALHSLYLYISLVVLSASTVKAISAVLYNSLAQKGSFHMARASHSAMLAVSWDETVFDIISLFSTYSRRHTFVESEDGLNK